MEKLFNNSKRWLTALGVVAFLMVAGWQVGANGTEEVFAETEVALENAVAGSAVAHDCTFTDDIDDECRYGIYLISKCLKKTTVVQLSNCGYTP